MLSKWKLAFVDNLFNNDNFNTKYDLKEIEDITFEDPNCYACADPFIFKGYIFAEVFDKSYEEKIINIKIKKNKYITKTHKKGVIGCSKIDKKLIFKTILSNNNFHYSFPLIFEKNNNIFMMPETHQAQKIILYKCKKFPYEWNEHKILIDKINAFDSIYFHLNNSDYIFTTKKVYFFRNKKMKVTYENDIYVSDNILKKPFKLLIKNPINNKYRGGGNVLYFNNKIYIPIQPFNLKNYGEKLYIYEIINNNNNIKLEFRFELEKKYNIDKLHHLSNYNNQFLIDYKINYLKDLKKKQWNLALIDNELKNIKIKKLFKYKFPKNIDINFGTADPFIFRNYIFCELIDNNLKNKEINIESSEGYKLKRIHTGGIICYAKIEDTLNFKILLTNEKCHYSFPFIFKKQEKIYMIPESSQLKNLSLYECIKFPDKWIKKKNLLKNKFLYDSIYFRIDNIDYLFTTEYRLILDKKKKYNKEYNNYIYYSKNILDKKLLILQKNIIQKKYRGGGNIFYKNNKLYIPIQPFINNTYGEKLYIYEILKDNNKLKFIFQYEIVKNEQMKGMHHLSNFDNNYIIDFFL